MPTKGQLIADDMEARIKNGEFSKSTRLPAVLELVKHYETSNRTISEAFEALKARGLIITKRGKGTFLKDDGS